MKKIIFFAFIISGMVTAQVPSENQMDLYNIIDEVSADRIENDVRKLAGFGTRNTFSDTVSNTRGIGAARRWIKAEFDKISADCGGCLEVFYQKDLVTTEMGNRVPKDAYVVNVVAIQRGTDNPNDMVMMSGDIDSRASDTMDFTTDAPGANDNASGMAGTIEAARVLSKRKFKNSIVYVGLSGEEQGLFGGKGLAEYAKKKEWNVIGFLNNDMIGNIKGVDGVIDNREFRIFSEPTDPTETERQRRMRRFYGGEVDGISRQLARYIHKSVKVYMPEMKPMMVYRLDRFGRGGHHRPFADLGFPGIRIMEAHENYTQQHQDIRVEDGIAYGDVVKHVNFPYARKLTAVNAINLAQLAWAPTPPENVKIGGIVEADAKLKWDKVKDAVGYKIYWRDTTSPTWDNSRYVGDVTEYTLKEIVIDNSFFGVAAVGKDGIESMVSFPSGVFR
ncbi:peptidase M28-like protein [Nonlabens dokdonensis]|uniref:Aminopeptidase n=2 Tax=Nonlabens dokdonensis TaxID=328515 RepID=L7WCH0_NONDD|nr:M28 family metallopeptidase [Nonlabens dokdonensis]AGC77779.1 aminopeptidase [Nonlabens dokdonensis DSW-6]PZX39687.1 peptidase M28-like protein [Nonlabens dokdonensis]